MRTHRYGLSLVEVLIVIGIIAVLAVILYPLFGVARDKTLEAKCSSNQQQIAQSILIWAQDHDDVLPHESVIWGALKVDQNVLKCPVKRAQYGYVYNSFVSKKHLAAIKDTLTTVLTADGQHAPTAGVSVTQPQTFQNVAYTPDDLAFRHLNEIVISFADGHVISTKDTRELSLELRNAPAAEFDGFDTMTKGSWWTPTARFRYGTKGYALCFWNGTDPTTSLGAANPDAYVDSVTPSGFTGINWSPTGNSDPRALYNPLGGTAASCWAGDGTIAVTLKPNPDPALANAIHLLHIYCLDWDRANRSMKIDIRSGSTPATSIIRKEVVVNAFGEGTWVNFRFRGNINIVTKGTGGGSAVISALAFE